MQQDKLDLDFLIREKQKEQREAPDADLMRFAEAHTGEGTRNRTGLSRDQEVVSPPSLTIDELQEIKRKLGADESHQNDDELSNLFETQFEHDAEFDDLLADLTEDLLILPTRLPRHEGPFLDRLADEDDDSMSGKGTETGAQTPDPGADAPPDHDVIDEYQQLIAQIQGQVHKEYGAEPETPVDEGRQDAAKSEGKIDTPEAKPLTNLREESNAPERQKPARPRAQKNTEETRSPKDDEADTEAKESTPPERPAREKEQPHARNKMGGRRFFSAPSSLASLFEDTRLLGLDIGSSAIKYVHVQQSARRLMLVNCGNFVVGRPKGATEAKDRENLAGAVLSQHPELSTCKNTMATTAVSGMEVIFKSIRLPKMPSRELSRAVPWACRKDLPFPLESAVFGFRKIRSTGKASGAGKHIFVVAVQKERVTNHLDILGRIGLVPAKISTVPAALWQVFRLCVQEDGDGCYGVVDIGANSSHIVFVNQGELQFARAISTAGADFTRALTGSLFLKAGEITIGEEQAERLKRKYGIPADPTPEESVDGIPLVEVSAIFGQVLQRLAAEVQRTTDSYKERFQVPAIKKIYLTGGGAMMPHLRSRLTRELKVEVAVLNPFETISLQGFENAEQIRKTGPRFAVAIGLALDKNRELNLLPAELRGWPPLQVLRRLLKYLAPLFVLVMVLLSQNVTRQLNKVERKFQQLRTEYGRSLPRRQRLERLQQGFRQFERLDQQLNAIQIHHGAASHLKVISQLIPRDVTLTSLRITPEQRQAAETGETHYLDVLTLDGVAFQSRSMAGMTLANFLLALEKSGYFRSIGLRHQQLQENGNLRFTIQCER